MIAPTPAGTNVSSASAASLFGSNAPSNVAKPSTSLKRKANDLNLPIVCIDTMHDLTLIVGTPDSPGGQKAFQVNKGSVRHASSVWGAMLSGDWAESGMSEVAFPDDSCYAFQIVLEIAHLQFAKLPESLTQKQLIDIAKLADKYDLGQVLPAVVEFKKWLQPYKDSAGHWPTDTDFQDFAIITSAFKLPAEFDYIINWLALHVNVDELGKYYYQDSKQKKVTLGSCLPSRVFGKIDVISGKFEFLRTDDSNKNL
ncbi:hypothetical protein FB567DRAFT_438069 [Paraphoma chrysanthemicola]|uniref:BTB domain-containing protein n=1 Tax=Paraphoma chrysanthemicola TaxID=798071 RepID=A0A8K0RDC1_9PLEO|nr:hypothetical protein FB567DRAFT_438069 [Paraphoma chrysanthemicola]